MKRIVRFIQWLREAEYRGHHKAPHSDDYSAPLHDMTRLYPDDIYGPDAERIYGIYGNRSPMMDRKSMSIIRAARGNPDLEVEIYRAVPLSVPNEMAMIFPGDWVTINRQYAILHGEGPLEGKYQILTKKVPAKHLYTHADSIHEWGYDPI